MMMSWIFAALVKGRFKCDSATLSFYASKDGKITVSFSGWDASKVVLEDQAFEVRWETYLGRAQD
jgi:hypothetical protein